MKKYAIVFKNGHDRIMLAMVTGQMTDGTKVWTECDEKAKEPINIDVQYTLHRKCGNYEFIRL